MQKGDGTLFSPARAGVFIEAHHSVLNSFHILAINEAQCSNNPSYFNMRHQSVMLLRALRASRRDRQKRNVPQTPIRNLSRLLAQPSEHNALRTIRERLSHPRRNHQDLMLYKAQCFKRLLRQGAMLHKA
ncbi:hypothetical protein P8452_66404 [Trifolium repens]|nr:hypothetical protein P8452_66404 [Trifolium repens]